MTDKSDPTKHYRTYEEELIAAEKKAAEEKARTKQYTPGTAQRLDVYEQTKSRPKIKFLLTAAAGVAVGMVIGAKMCSKPKLTPGQIERICGLPEPCPEPKSVSAAEPPKPSVVPASEASENENEKRELVKKLLKKYRTAKEKERYYSAFETLFELLALEPGKISVRKVIDSLVAEGNLEALKLLRRKLKLSADKNPEFEELRVYASKHIRQMREAQ